MHIPDGFLSGPVSGGCAVLSFSALALALRQTSRHLRDCMIPRMGVLAAFVFAAQMLNFPVAAGTSGHLVGGVLTAIIVGPLAASIVVTCVLIVQCLLFQDGGLIALGANILNMAVVGTWGGWLLFALIKKIFRGMLGMNIATFVGAWFSIVVSSACVALELGLSQTAKLSVVLFAMVGIHSIIGVAEGIISIFIVSFLKRVKPEYIA